MGGTLRGRMLVVSAALALVMGATFVVLLVSIDDLRRSSDLDRQSAEVLVAANRLERLVVDLETGLRGFVITGAERFLQPWNAARPEVVQQASALELLVASEPDQERRAREIAAAINAYVVGYGEPLVDIARDDPAAARSEEITAEGKRRLDAVRAQFDSFIASERARAERRHQDAETAQRRATVAAITGVVGSVLLVVVFSGYLNRVIVRPVRDMAGVARRIAAGDLSARTAESGVAEIGMLGRSFNEMASSVERTQGDLARFAEEQSALRRVATLVAEGTSPSEVFGAVTQEVARLLRADLAHLVRYEPDGTASGVAGWSDGGMDVPIGSHVPLDGENVSASVFGTGRPSRMDSYEHASGPIAIALRELGVHSSVGSPIVVDGRLWGAIVVSVRGDRRLAPDAEGRLTVFTELVATAISNAHARQELTASRARIVTAGDAARRRIERNLHDGTQQRLVSLGLELRTAELEVPAELSDVRAQLHDVAQGLEELLEELREISRGIHPAILSEGGLGPALKALARRSPIPVELDLRTDVRLPEPVEVATYFVASEALANAAKHARASVVRVVLDTPGDVIVKLSMVDDGTGGADPSGGSGLIGVRDRVEALGGRVTIASRIGKGTSIDAELPIQVPGREDRGTSGGTRPIS